MFKPVVLALMLLVGTASGFAPLRAPKVVSTILSEHKLGSGGMADTRDPDAFQHEDARKSISVAPSFEEYMKARGGGGGEAAPAPALAYSAPAPAPAYSAPAPAPAPMATSGGRNYSPFSYSPRGGSAAPAYSAPAPAPAPAPQAYAPPAAAYTPPAPAPAPTGGPHLGSGGMADTRDPDAFQHEDARKSISVAPSFEEYMKQRQ